MTSVTCDRSHSDADVNNIEFSIGGFPSVESVWSNKRQNWLSLKLGFSCCNLFWPRRSSSRLDFFPEKSAEARKSRPQPFLLTLSFSWSVYVTRKHHGVRGALTSMGVGTRWGWLFLRVPDWFQGSHVDSIFSLAVTFSHWLYMLSGTKCVIGLFWVGRYIIKLPLLTSLAILFIPKLWDVKIFK